MKNLNEVIELSDAAARLLSANASVGSSKAKALADALTTKAIKLLEDENATTESGVAQLSDLPAVMKLLGIGVKLVGREVPFIITPKPEDPKTVNVTATVK